MSWSRQEEPQTPSVGGPKGPAGYDSRFFHMEMEQESAMGVTPAEGCGQREKEQQDAVKAEQCRAPEGSFLSSPPGTSHPRA